MNGINLAEPRLWLWFWKFQPFNMCMLILF